MTAKPEVNNIWASSGEATEPGVPKQLIGWVAEIPTFQAFNWKIQQHDTFNKYLNEEGILHYDATTDYPLNAYVKGSDGVVYKSLIVNGPASTIEDPVGDVSGTWQKAFLETVGDIVKISELVDDHFSTSIITAPTANALRVAANVSWNRPERFDTSALSIPGITTPALAAMGSTIVGEDRVAFADGATGKLGMYKIDAAGVVSLVGSTLTIAGIGRPQLTALSDTEVVLYDTSLAELRTYSFNGTIWALVGAGLAISSGAVTVVGIAALNSTDIALGYDNHKLATYHFDGAVWVLLGNIKIISGLTSNCITALTATTIAVFDVGGVNDFVRTYSFDGADWTTVDGSFELPTAIGANGSVTALNGFDVAIVSGGLRFHILRYNPGTGWSSAGRTLDLDTGVVTWATAISAINGTDIMFIDEDNEELRVYRHTFSIGLEPPGQSLVM